MVYRNLKLKKSEHFLIIKSSEIGRYIKISQSYQDFKNHTRIYNLLTSERSDKLH